MRPVRSLISKKWTAWRKPGKIRSIGRFFTSLSFGKSKSKKGTAMKKKKKLFLDLQCFLCENLTGVMNFMYSCNLHVEVHISFVTKGLVNG